jgi:TBC1 domain family member 15
LELPGLASLKSASFKNSGVSIHNSDYDQANGSVQNSSSFSVHSSRPTNKNKQGDLSMQVLEKFSLVTRFARETTSSLFRENHGNQYPYDKFLDKHKSTLNNKDESKHEEDVTSHESNPVVSDVSEVYNFYLLANTFRMKVIIEVKFDYLNIMNTVCSHLCLEPANK